MKLRTTLISLFVFVALLASPSGFAGPYGDTLGKCLVSKTNSSQKATLVRWLFAMMALHPDVESSSTLTAAQRTQLSKEAARLLEDLLTQTCRAEAVDAIRYEGHSTVEASFSLLGQVAARELFAHPKVAEGLAEFGQFVDEKKMKALMEGRQQ